MVQGSSGDGVCLVYVRRRDISLSICISQLVLTSTDGEGTSFASSEVPTCAAILVVVVPASRGGREEK